MAIETVRLSQQARDQLITLKRYTGIEHWNVLCRWALATSLAEPTDPPPTKIPADSSVEMTWKVFAGPCSDAFIALLRQRLHQRGQGVDDVALDWLFRAHLHRGISALVGRRTLGQLVGAGAKVTVS